MFFGKTFWQFVIAILVVQVLLFGSVGYYVYETQLKPLIVTFETVADKVNDTLSKFPFNVNKPTPKPRTK